MRAVYEMAQRDLRVCFIGSDLGVGVMDDFGQIMPERLFREGISEQHIIGMAGGLALEGKIVYVNTLATFITRRCFEQIMLDLALYKAKVRLIGSGGGLVYAPLGPTHVTTDDIGILRMIPNLGIIAPCDAEEMRRIMPLTLDWDGPLYIRLSKGGDKVVSREEAPLAIGRAIPFEGGKDALLMCTGIGLQVCLEAAAILRKGGTGVSVLHFPTIKPLDIATILACVPDYGVVVTVEEHSVIGGLGSAVAEVLAEADLSRFPRFRRIGFPDAFVEHYGSQEEHLALWGLTPEAVARTIAQLRG
jgi:transketolase